MLMNDYTPAKPCTPNTPDNSKIFFGFNEQYFVKLDLDLKSQNIIILCYDTTELENKRYEIKLNKMDFDYSNKIFKLYDKIEEIYGITYQVFEFNRYKIIESKDDILPIELNYIINIDNNKIEFNIKLDLKPNTNGDFTSDYNYILRNEIINLKKKYKKDISELKKENKNLTEELNQVKQMIKDLRNDLGNKTDKKKVSPKKIEKTKTPVEKVLNLKGKIVDNKALKNLENYPDLERLNLSSNKITDISILNKCIFKELKELNLSNNLISNISVLKDLKLQKLNELYLNQNKITDLEPLAKIDLTHIKIIDLSFNFINDLNTFYRINAPQLNYLNLSHNQIEDITVFSSTEFKNMKELYLDNNKIDQDISSYLIELLRQKITKLTC